MDPDALWQMILDNLRILNCDPQNRDERDNVISNLRDLIDWLQSGGFPPTITGGDHGKLSGARTRPH
jgi:hypothetical protein